MVRMMTKKHSILATYLDMLVTLPKNVDLYNVSYITISESKGFRIHFEVDDEDASYLTIMGEHFIWDKIEPRAFLPAYIEMVEKILEDRGIKISSWFVDYALSLCNNQSNKETT
jgi:hypothetical protein